MSKLVKGLVGGIGATFMGGKSNKGAKAAAAQAQVQQQIAQVNQMNAVAEQNSASSRAMGSAARSRRGSRLLAVDQGKATLG